MNRRIVAVFAAFSILISALATASVVYRVLSAETEGKTAASADFERLSAELSGVQSASDLADEALRAKLAAHYRASPRLLLVAVYERGSGLRWRIPAGSDYLPASENQKPFPEPRYPDRSSLLLSAPLRGDITGRLAVDALYSTIGQSTVFLAFRDAILALGAYLAAAAVVLALIAAAGRKATLTEALAASPRPADAARQDETPTGPSYAPPEDEFQVPELKAFDLPVDDTATLIPTIGQSLPAPASPDANQATGLYSPASGLGWESYQAERLDAELARSASFEQDLSLLLIAHDGLVRGSTAYNSVAKALQDFFTFRDLAFERGVDGFSVILPNIDIDSALRMAEEFLKKLTFLLRDYRKDPLEFLPVFMGLSSRAGRLVDSSRIAQEASAALQKSRDDCDTHIIAFRPDPDKYRLYLASKDC